MLEGMSGELAAQRITEPELAELRALHYEMLACFSRRDLSGYYRLNARIHAGINEAAKNPVLTSTYRSVNARVQSLRFRTNQDEAKWKRAVAEHEAMLKALEAHDAAALRDGADGAPAEQARPRARADACRRDLPAGRASCERRTMLIDTPQRLAPLGTELPHNDVSEALARRLRSETEGAVMFDAASRGRYATDASIYQIMPVGVFVPTNERDIATAIADRPRAEGAGAAARRRHQPVRADDRRGARHRQQQTLPARARRERGRSAPRPSSPAWCSTT